MDISRKFHPLKCVIFLLHHEFSTKIPNFLLHECLNFLQVKRLVLKRGSQFFRKKNKMWMRMSDLAVLGGKHGVPPLKHNVT